MSHVTPVAKEQILAALAAVPVPGPGPGPGQNLVEAGMVHGLVVRDGHVGFSLEVDPARGAELEPVRKAAEAAAYKVPGVLSVTAVLTAHTGQPAQPHPAPGRAPSPQGPLQIPGIKTIIAVASGKGGVGKSTVAVNLAIALTRLGHRAGLLDADVYGPSVPRLLGITGKPETRDGKKLLPIEKYGLKTMSIGFLVAEDTAIIWRGPMVQSALTQMLRDVEWGELDMLIIDMPPGTGDAQLTLAQRVPLTGAIIISTPQEIALIDARKGIAMFEKTHVPVLGMVENMAYFTSPGSGEKSYIFGEGGVRRMAGNLGCDFLGEIPLYMSIRENSDAGTPVTASHPDSPEATIFVELARKVSDKISVLSDAPPTAPRILIED